MYYAVIDVGSNTMRLSVYKHENDSIERLISQKEVVGLVQYIEDGVMETEGIGRMIETLSSFQSIARKFAEPANTRVFSAAALRCAQNRDQIISQVRESTGITIDLISGEEEARLDYVGVARWSTCGEGMILDIGGASAELVRMSDGHPSALVSLPIGCLSLHRKYVSRVLPTDSEYKAIKKAVREQFDAIHWTPDAACAILFGVGGTIRALAKLIRHLSMTSPGVKEIPVKTALEAIKLLRKNSPGMLDAVYKTSPERIPTLIPGLAIFKEAAKRFGCESLIASEYGVREGYLIDRMLGKDENKNEVPAEDCNQVESGSR